VFKQNSNSQLNPLKYNSKINNDLFVKIVQKGMKKVGENNKFRYYFFPLFMRNSINSDYYYFTTLPLIFTSAFVIAGTFMPFLVLI
jgi:hypothetical protein